MPSVTRRNRTASPSTRAHPCMTAASARASIACRWASWSIATPCASMTRARTSGPSAMRFGAGWWRSSPGRSAIRSSTARPSAASCRRCSPARSADTLPELARKLGLPEAQFVRTVQDYNAACRLGTFDHTALDDCHTEGLTPAKTHWARPLDQAPFYGYALRPGITFTYLGLKVNDRAQVHFGGKASGNLFVAGEMMAGNVLGKGYTAGVGMSIGTAFGRIAGTQAAQAAGIKAGAIHAEA
ncbi:FAD-binding protein [Cupriavidus basilensis]